MKLRIAVILAVVAFSGMLFASRVYADQYQLAADELAYLEDNLDVLYDAGIINGYPGGDFKGDNEVTRYEAAAVITRFYGYLLDEMNDRGILVMEFVDIRSPVDGPMDMTDVPESHWAYDELLRLEHMGVASGFPDWTWKGAQTANRWQFAALLLRAVVLIDFGLWEAVPGYDGGFRHTHNAKPETIEGAPEEYWAQPDIRALIERHQVSTSDGVGVSDETVLTRSEMAFVILRLMMRFENVLDNIPQ